MTSLITGSGGFAGSHLMDFLLAQGQEVVGLAAQDEDLEKMRAAREVRFEQADLRDAQRMRKVLKQTRPQRIYHLAALSSPTESLKDPRTTFSVNFEGTLNLLLAWRELQFESRLLYVSSSDVYGLVREEGLPLREETQLRPTNPYAASKAAAEFLALQFFRSYGLPVVVVRPFNHTGPGQSDKFVCSSMARQVAEINLGRRPAKVAVGNIRLQRDFSDVRDIVRGYRLLLEEGELGEVYQLCSGRAVSLEEILQVLISMASEPIQVEAETSRMRAQETPVLYGDSSKARRAVGWEPQCDLQTTLRDLEAYWERVLRAS
jgi:GDP-4-dehydro-6-deoxy-D-mannose reductase